MTFISRKIMKNMLSDNCPRSLIMLTKTKSMGFCCALIYIMGISINIWKKKQRNIIRKYSIFLVLFSKINDDKVSEKKIPRPDEIKKNRRRRMVIVETTTFLSRCVLYM